MVAWFGLFLLLLMGVAALSALLHVDDNGLVFIGIPGGLAAAILIAWYGSRKPRGKQSSYYQPVFLRLATGGSIILAFLNDQYGKEFASMNPGSRLGIAVNQRKLIADC